MNLRLLIPKQCSSHHYCLLLLSLIFSLLFIIVSLFLTHFLSLPLLLSLSLSPLPLSLFPPWPEKDLTFTVFLLQLEHLCKVQDRDSCIHFADEDSGSKWHFIHSSYRAPKWESQISTPGFLTMLLPAEMLPVPALSHGKE